MEQFKKESPSKYREYRSMVAEAKLKALEAEGLARSGSTRYQRAPIVKGLEVIVDTPASRKLRSESKQMLKKAKKYLKTEGPKHVLKRRFRFGNEGGRDLGWGKISSKPSLGKNDSSFGEGLSRGLIRYKTQKLKKSKGIFGQGSKDTMRQ